MGKIVLWAFENRFFVLPRKEFATQEAAVTYAEQVLREQCPVGSTHTAIESDVQFHVGEKNGIHRVVSVLEDHMKASISMERRRKSSPSQQVRIAVTGYRPTPRFDGGMTLHAVGRLELRYCASRMTKETVEVNGKTYSRDEVVDDVFLDWTPLKDLSGKEYLVSTLSVSVGKQEIIFEGPGVPEIMADD